MPVEKIIGARALLPSPSLVREREQRRKRGEIGKERVVRCVHGGSHTSSSHRKPAGSHTPARKQPAGGQTRTAGSQTEPAVGKEAPGGGQAAPASDQAAPARRQPTPASSPATPIERDQRAEGLPNENLPPPIVGDHAVAGRRCGRNPGNRSWEGERGREGKK
ncbi:uncharacterized protein LOC122004112 [Zingiber officinale]|uniref:uncharacterized protein LOC122004112 n=1 Tax=Zingiber officinale TaxID=94328 RepID=UPI001C4C74DF|nr:uncharacterized protein LOC122004112 [Zingiber officinale]